MNSAWWSQWSPVFRDRFIDHLGWVAVATTLGSAVGLLLGLSARGWRWSTRLVRFLGGVMIAVPPVVLLPSGIVTAPRFNSPWYGVAMAATVAGFVVRRTTDGLASIEPAIGETAIALGMSRLQRAWTIGVPLARRDILTGVRWGALSAAGMVALLPSHVAGFGVFIQGGGEDVSDSGLVGAGLVGTAVVALLVDVTLLVSSRFIRRRWI